MKVQVFDINNTIKSEYTNDTTGNFMKFGKCQGKSDDWVIKNFPGYVKWMENIPVKNSLIKHFINYVNNKEEDFQVEYCFID
jgi:hypothetical protein